MCEISCSRKTFCVELVKECGCCEMTAVTDLRIACHFDANFGSWGSLRLCCVHVDFGLTVPGRIQTEESV
jgi:hypothetical protein